MTSWLAFIAAVAVAGGVVAFLVAALRLSERTLADLRAEVASEAVEAQAAMGRASEVNVRLRTNITHLRAEITLLEADLAACSDARVVHARLRRLLAGTNEGTYQEPPKG